MPGIDYQECVITDSSCPIGRVWELRDGRLIQHADAPARVVAGLLAG